MSNMVTMSDTCIHNITYHRTYYILHRDNRKTSITKTTQIVYAMRVNVLAVCNITHKNSVFLGLLRLLP